MADTVLFSDNIYGTIASGITAAATSITLTTGHGARFPTVVTGQILYAVLVSSANVVEQIHITAHTAASDTITVTRGANGTTAKTWSAGDRIECRVTSEHMNKYVQTILTPEQFGAIGNNSTDCTTAIGELRDAVRDLSGNCTVLLSGRYVLTSSIAWGDDLFGLKFKGNFGNDSSFSTASVNETSFAWSGAATGAIFTFGTNINDFTVDGVGFDGNLEGLRLRPSAGASNRNWKIKNSRFKSTNFGIAMGYDWADTTSDADVNGVEIETCRFGTTGIGIQWNIASNGYKFRVKDCTFRGDQGIRSRGIKDVRIEDVDGNLTGTTGYMLDFLGGGGYFEVDGVYLEGSGNVRLLRQQSWTSAFNAMALVKHVGINSTLAETDPTIDMSSPTVFIDVQVSNQPSGGPNVIRSIKADNGYISLRPGAASGILDTYTSSGTEVGIIIGGGRIFERERTVAMGQWTDVAYSAGNFTASGSMTWTVAEADQIYYKYSLVGKMMTVDFHINNSSVGGTPSTVLNIAVPGSNVARVSQTYTAFFVGDNGTERMSMATINSDGTQIQLFATQAGANWTASTNNTYVRGSITFEIQ